MSNISGTENQSDVGIKPIKEDIWKFFDTDAFKSLNNTKVVSISQLISEDIEISSIDLFTGGINHSVYKAYNFFRRATEGDKTVKPREPITVRDNGGGTFTIIDGLATTSVAKMLGWKFLPVEITEIAKV